MPDTSTLGVPFPNAANCVWVAGAAGSVANADELVGQAGWHRFTNMNEATSDGSYVVVATARGKTASTLAVDLRAPAPADRLELALASCASKLVGNVQDASGGTIAHARVARDDAPWPFAETDSNGRYELCLPFGHTSIEISADGSSEGLATNARAAGMELLRVSDQMSRWTDAADPSRCVNTNVRPSGDHEVGI